jgi:thiamine-monophosphate kinase
VAAAGATVADLGERAVIERIRAAAGAAPDWVVIGIGDDAAVVEPPRNALEVVTTDALVEGVHFDRRFSSAADVGHKALAVNLSDLAAMGAAPRAALLSLALPGGFAVADLDALVSGFLALAAAHRVSLIGGNVTSSPGPLVVDVTAMGAVGRRKMLRRGGAKPGDELFVSGSIGRGGAGLGVLRAEAAGAPHTPAFESLVHWYRRPAPRVRLGVLVGRNRAASACVDLSDGLADAARQIAAASGTGIAIDAGALAIDPAAKAWYEQRQLDPVRAALGAGDDYELLFAVPRRMRSRFAAAGRLVQDAPLTRVGVVTAEPAMVVRREGRSEPLPAGFEHFGPAS